MGAQTFIVFIGVMKLSKISMLLLHLSSPEWHHFVLGFTQGYEEKPRYHLFVSVILKGMRKRNLLLMLK